MDGDIINRRHILHLPPWPTVAKTSTHGVRCSQPSEIVRRQIAIQEHNECYCFLPHAFQCLFYLISFLSFLYVYLCVYVCWHVCSVYAIHMCMSIWRPEVNTGSHSSDAVHLFWWQGPLPTWCSLSLPPPPPQCAPLDLAFMATWQAFHWLSISSDLDSFSCHQHLHVLLSNSLVLSLYISVPMCVCLDFPQIILVFTFLSSLSMTKKLHGFCSSEWILGLVVHIPFFFAFLTPPRIHRWGHYPGLP